MDRIWCRLTRPNRWLVVAAVLLLSPLLSAARPAVSPEFDLPAFLAAMRQRLRSPEDAFRQHRYLQRVTEQERDASGRVSKTTVSLYEVYPDLQNGEGYSRLIERNGRPLQPAEAAHLERDQRSRVEAAVRRRASESPDARQKRLEGEDAERRNLARTLDDVFRICAFRVVARETFHGEPAVVLAFSARRGAQPFTDSGRVLAKAKGLVWVSEVDQEVIRAELESNETISYGLGIVARVRPGARLVFDRQRTAEGWLPASYSLVARVTFLLVKPTDYDRTVEYSEFRRFPSPDTGSVQTGRD